MSFIFFAVLKNCGFAVCQLYESAVEMASFLTSSLLRAALVTTACSLLRLIDSNLLILKTPYLLLKMFLERARADECLETRSSPLLRVQGPMVEHRPPAYHTAKDGAVRNLLLNIEFVNAKANPRSSAPDELLETWVKLCAYCAVIKGSRRRRLWNDGRKLVAKLWLLIWFAASNSPRRRLCRDNKHHASRASMVEYVRESIPQPTTQVLQVK